MGLGVKRVGRKKGWQQIQTTPVYDNPWISVRHDRVIQPAGTEGIYGVVHFKNLAIGIVPIDEHGNTWLVKQHRYPLAQDSWEIPEGGCPEGEHPLDAARRELEEEVGLRAHLWRELMTLHLSNSVTDEKALVFVAQQLEQGHQALEDSEDIELMKLPLVQAIEMARDGRITDAISVAALLRLAHDRL